MKLKSEGDVLKSRIFMMIGFLLLIGPFLDITFAQQNKTCVYFFYGETCPHCAEEESFLEELKQSYPQIEIHQFEVYYNKDNRNLYNAITKQYGVRSSGVPMTFIGEKVFTGFAEGDVEIFDSKSNAYVGYSGIIEKTIKEFIGKGGIECPSVEIIDSDNNSLLASLSSNFYIIFIFIMGGIGLIFYKMGIKIKVRAE